MQKVLSAEEMREVDRLTTEKYGIPSIILMENAAHAAARVITEKLGGSVKGKSFLILCGKGNNGGDGAALARILWNQGATVETYLFGKVEETKGDARVNFEILRNIDQSVEIIVRGEENALYITEISADENVSSALFRGFKDEKVIVDALFGTGLTRKLEGNIVETLKNFYCWENNSFKPLLVAIDVPSGINADLAEPIGENFKADLTVTFTAPKLANVLPPASNFNGELFVANIGSPQELIENSPSQLFLSEKEDARTWLYWTKFTENSYKNKRGHALLIVGSRDYTGAAALAGNAAMVSGVGLTTVATSESAQTAIASKTLEEVITRGLPENENGTISEQAFTEIEKLTEKADVIGLGCGLGDLGLGMSDSGLKDKANNLVRQIVEKRQTPMVIDADGLNTLSPFDLQGSDDLPLILTPHKGEFIRLLGTKEKDAIKDRVKAVRDFAEKHHVILVLKGERALIASPDGRVVINPTGNPGLGKAGNGDTLTGIITGFIAQAVQAKIDIFETVVAAVYIAGLAGDIAENKHGKRTMLASDVRGCLSEAFQQLEHE